MRTIFNTLLWYLIIAAAPIEYVNAQNSSDNYLKNKEIIVSKEIAVQNALKFSGFDLLNGFNKNMITSIDSIVMHDYSINFLNPILGEKTAWLIEVSGLILDENTIEMAPGVKYPDQFNIYIDKVTGNLLYLESNFIYSNRELSSNWTKSFLDSILTIPSIPGKIEMMANGTPSKSFIDMLKSVSENFPKARQYIACYILYSHPLFQPEPRPTWCLILKEGIVGLTPFGSDYSDKNGKRIAIGITLMNAETEKIVFAKIRTFPTK